MISYSKERHKGKGERLKETESQHGNKDCNIVFESQVISQHTERFIVFNIGSYAFKRVF